MFLCIRISVKGPCYVLCMCQINDQEQTTLATFTWIPFKSSKDDFRFLYVLYILFECSKYVIATVCLMFVEEKEGKLGWTGLVVTRDTKWLTTTSGNLCILVKQVGTVRGHCNWRVRLGLVECAEHLLLHCTR